MRGSELATATSATVKMRRLPELGICVIRVSGEKRCAGLVIQRLEMLVRCQETYGLRDPLRGPDSDVDDVVGPITMDFKMDANNQRALAAMHHFIVLNTGQMAVETDPPGIAPAVWETFWTRPEHHSQALAVQRERTLSLTMRIAAIRNSIRGYVYA